MRQFGEPRGTPIIIDELRQTGHVLQSYFAIALKLHAGEDVLENSVPFVPLKNKIKNFLLKIVMAIFTFL